VITILAVGEDAEALAAFGAAHPSVEVVAARGAEDALERLARNRRIDAVLLLAGTGASRTAALILEEDPGAPPVFAAFSEASGVRRIEPGPPEAMLSRVIQELSAQA
jgi:hypothetical protein